MPVTRSQATYNTRSTGRATLPDSIQQKKGKNVASNSNSRERPTSAQLDDHLVKGLLLKIRSITFRSLVNEHFPWARDVLQRFRRTHPGVDVIFTVIVIIYIVYKIHNHPLYNAFCSIVPFASQIWQRMFPAELPGIYHNNVLQPPKHRWIQREKEVSTLGEQIKRMCEDHERKVIHVYLTGRPGSGKSEFARQVVHHLKESQKHNKRPMAFITIQADNADHVLLSLRDAVFAVNRMKMGKTADIVKELSSRLNFERMLLVKEADVQKSQIKVLYNKLDELLEDMLPVLIFDNVKDLEFLNDLNLTPGNDHIATAVVVIITLQNHVSLERLPSDCVHVQDLNQGMSPNDSVKLLELIAGTEVGDKDYLYELADFFDHQPQNLSNISPNIIKDRCMGYLHVKRFSQITLGDVAEKKWLPSSLHVIVKFEELCHVSSAVTRPNGQPRQAGVARGVRIPKPRIPDSRSKKFLDSGIRIPLHGARREPFLWIKCHGSYNNFLF